MVIRAQRFKLLGAAFLLLLGAVNLVVDYGVNQTNHKLKHAQAAQNVVTDQISTWANNF